MNNSGAMSDVKILKALADFCLEEEGLQTYTSVRALAQKAGLSKQRSEEHTSELQSHSFISYAVFCLKKKKYQYKNIFRRA